jgi:RNA polymerase sigma-B factor
VPLASTTVVAPVSSDLNRNLLVVDHLPLADAVARRFAHRGIDVDDLTQVARLAMVKAAIRFRPDAGASFSTFARVTVEGEIKRHFRDHRWAVRPPRRLQEGNAAVRDAEERLRQQLGREPKPAELLSVLGMTEVELAEVRNAASGVDVTSLEALASESGDGRVPEHLVFADHAEASTDAVRLRAAMARLTPRQRLLLALRFQEDLSQSEIGARLCVSQMQVSRLLAATLAELHDLLVASEDAA